MTLFSLPTGYGDRILTAEQGFHQRKGGRWIAADLHVHSSCSHDVLPSPEFHPEALYQRARSKGLGFITITDHDTMAAYDVIGWERENLVTGVEITLRDPIRVGHTLHINVYQLDKRQFAELSKIARFDQNIETFIAFLRENNLPYIYNHPFWFVAGDKPDYRAVEDIIELFPVIEYNMKRVRKKNMLAMWLAAKYGKGIISCTDTHVGSIGRAYTLSQGDTFQQFFSSITEGNALIVPQDLTLSNLNQEIQTWIEVLFDLDEIKGGKARFTGIQPVDAAINFLANHTIDEYPRTFPILERVINMVAKSSVLSGCYLLSQNHTAAKISKLLQIPDLA